MAPPVGQIPGLDGLRGMAVAAVVAYHLGYGWAQGGYLGRRHLPRAVGFPDHVGLLDEHARPAPCRSRAFWGRRARRLLPALLGPRRRRRRLGRGRRASRRGAQPPTRQPLRPRLRVQLAVRAHRPGLLRGRRRPRRCSSHTWSLGVEAQLYLVWPPVAIYVLRPPRPPRRRPRRPSPSPPARGRLGAALAHPGNVNRAYYGTDTRAAGFLLGAAVAAALVGNVTPPGRRSRPSSPCSAWRGRG